MVIIRVLGGRLRHSWSMVSLRAYNSGFSGFVWSWLRWDGLAFGSFSWQLRSSLESSWGRRRLLLVEVQSDHWLRSGLLQLVFLISMMSDLFSWSVNQSFSSHGQLRAEKSRNMLTWRWFDLSDWLIRIRGWNSVTPLSSLGHLCLTICFSFQMNVNCAERKISVVGNNNIVHFDARMNISDANCRIFESSSSTDIMFLIIVSLGFVFCIVFCYCHSRNRLPRNRNGALRCSDSQTITHVWLRSFHFLEQAQILKGSSISTYYSQTGIWYQ